MTDDHTVTLGRPGGYSCVPPSGFASSDRRHKVFIVVIFWEEYPKNYYLRVNPPIKVRRECRTRQARTIKKSASQYIGAIVLPLE